ncbi:Rz-like spanin [Klebsiella phage MY01]|nr:Rz-like spanin [Pseudomonas phage MY01]
MIDKTKLIKLGLIALALISVGAFLSWYITSNHYETALAKQKSTYDGKLKSVSDEAAIKLGNEVARNNKLQKDLADLDAKRYQELQHEKDANDKLTADIASGKRRVLFAEANLATCKLSRSAGTKTSSMGDGTSLELSATAGQNILGIRRGIIEDQAKLDYLQDYIRKVEASKDGKVNNQTKK